MIALRFMWRPGLLEDLFALISGRSHEGEECCGYGTNPLRLKSPNQRHFFPPKDSFAQRMWMSVCCNLMLVRMGAPVPTAMGAMAVYVLMAGVEMTAVRTLMTVPSPPALRAPPALTVWPPSLACAQKERQVRPAGQNWSSGTGPVSIRDLFHSLSCVLLISICRNMLLKTVLEI